VKWFVVRLHFWKTADPPARKKADGDPLRPQHLRRINRGCPTCRNKPARFALLPRYTVIGYLMSAADFKSVDEYIALQPDSVRPVLDRVWSTIRKAVPEAEEVISYKMPTYKLRAGPVLYLAGWKQHFSLYPASATLVAAFEDELAPYVVSKGTIRFPFSQPVPVKLIARIAKFRAKEVAAREKADAASRRKR
jgi:uncharacterized protein YdhG (YjbR/CyaY superfamily)